MGQECKSNDVPLVKIFFLTAEEEQVASDKQHRATVQ
jgi:hypothetical protein